MKLSSSRFQLIGILLGVALAVFTSYDVLAMASNVYHERSGNNTGGVCGYYVEVLSPIAGQDEILRAVVSFGGDTDHWRLYYTTDGSTPLGSQGTVSGTTTAVAEQYTCTFTSGGQDYTVVTFKIPAQSAGTPVHYIIGAWSSAPPTTEVFANGGGCTSASCATVFSYTVATPTAVNMLRMSAQSESPLLVLAALTLAGVALGGAFVWRAAKHHSS